MPRCPYCGKQLRTVKGLKIHITRLHKSFKSYKALWEERKGRALPEEPWELVDPFWP